MLLPFSPPPGINSDDTTFSAESQWADGNNVRFLHGKPQPIGGSSSSAINPGAACRDIFAFNRAGTPTLVFGREGGIISIATDLNSAAVARSPSPPPSSNEGWSLAAWGNTLLAAVVGGTLYEQSGTGAATVVANAPDRIDAGVMVTQQRQVLAFGCNEEVSGTHNPLCIRGSDIEDYTDWTTSSTNNAFEHILDSGGAIVAKTQVGPYLAVWTETSLYMGQFIGDPLQTYSFERVADNCGAISLRSVVVLNGVAYWMGRDRQLRAWSPGAPVAAIPCTMSRSLDDNFNIINNVHSILVANTAWNEIWFFYFDSRDTSVNAYPTRYVAYSINESARARRPVWFQGILGAPGSDDAHAALYDETAGYVPPFYSPFLTAGKSGSQDRIFLFDFAGQVPANHIQSADLYLDQSERRVMVRRIIPDIEGSGIGGVDITLFMRDRPLSAAVMKGPYKVTDSPLVTKLDLRTSGKIIAVKLSNAGDAEWIFGKLVLDIVPMGIR